MTVSLKPDLEKFLAEQVKRGCYDSVDDALNAAVARLQAERDFTPEEVARLRQELDGAIAEADRGEFAEFTAEDIIRERRTARGQ